MLNRRYHCCHPVCFAYQKTSCLCFLHIGIGSKKRAGVAPNTAKLASLQMSVKLWIGHFGIRIRGFLYPRATNDKISELAVASGKKLSTIPRRKHTKSRAVLARTE